MSLSNDLVSRFAKVINNKEQSKKESPPYGTIIVKDGIPGVQLDGSDRVTPISSTVEVKDGDRVMVSVKNHTATVTGNLSDPSAGVAVIYDTTTGAIGIANAASATAEAAKAAANAASDKADTASDKADAAKLAAENASKTAGEAKAEIDTIKDKADTAKSAADTANEKAQEAIDAAKEAGKIATNYLYYDETNGLQIGDRKNGSWVGFFTRIRNDAFEVLNSAGEVLAYYGASLIELGRDSVSTIITLCGGKGRIFYDSDGERLTISSDDIHVQGTERASVSSRYTNASGVNKNSAVNTSADDGVQITSGTNSGSGWETSEILVKPDYVEMKSERFDIDGPMYNKLAEDESEYISFVYGTSGIWKYRKWANGQVELWGSLTISDMSCSAAVGSMYRTSEITPPSFPFSVYSPVVTASYESSGYGAMLWPTAKSSSSAPPKYYLMRPNSGTVNGQINFYVRGTY